MRVKNGQARSRFGPLCSVLGIVLFAASAAAPGSCDRDLGKETGYASLEADVVRRINEYRSGRGLPELKVDERLVDQARRHSASMAAGDVTFGHGGFRERLAASGVRFEAAAENVGQNEGFSEPAAQAVASWVGSKGHRANIVGDFELTGVGVARSLGGVYYFTQMFGRERE